MNVYDFIKDGQLDVEALEKLKKNIKYEEEKSDLDTYLWFDNGVVYAVFYKNGDVAYYSLCDADKKSATFSKNYKLLSIIDLNTKIKSCFDSDGKTLQEIKRENKDGSTEYFQDDGITLKEIRYDNGGYLCFYEDGKTIKFYKKDENVKVVYFNKTKGALLAGRRFGDIEFLLPIIDQLPKLTVKIDKGGFVNEMADKMDETKLSPLPDGYMAICRPNFIKDEDIPQIIKSIGIKIKRVVKDFFVEFDKDKKLYIYKDKDGKEITVWDSGASGENIKIYTRRYILKTDDYQRLKKLDDDIQKAVENADKGKEVSAKYDALYAVDRGLRNLYMDIFMDRENICVTLYHEAKHIINSVLCEHRAFASDYKKPTEEEEYKLCVEEERSATFEALNRAIKKYFTEGNYLYSTFSPDFDWVIDKLKGCSKEEIQEKLYPPIEIMNEQLQRWNDAYIDMYFESFKNQCLYKSRRSLFAPTDETGEEFRKQLSLKYTYEVYNPYTQKTELEDLSSAIKVGIPISEKVQEEIIKPCMEERQNAKKKLKEMFADKKSEIWAANLAEYMQRLLVRGNITGIDEQEKIQEKAKSDVPIHSNWHNCQLSEGDNLLQKIVEQKLADISKDGLTLETVQRIIQINRNR